MFTVAPSRILEGRWAVYTQDGSVARRPQRCDSRRTEKLAVYRDRAEAEALAARLNRHLPKDVA